MNEENLHTNQLWLKQMNLNNQRKQRENGEARKKNEYYSVRKMTL